MSTTTRNPTMVAECGCPHDPEYDEGSLGWHLTETHIPEQISSIQGQLASVLSNWTFCARRSSVWANSGPRSES